METTPLEPNPPESKTRPSRLWRILRLLPILLMLTALVALFILFLMGDLRKITAWYLLQIIPLVLGLISILAIVVYVIIKRRFSWLLILTTLIALLSMAPAILMVRPIAFSASLESTTPSATGDIVQHVPR